MIRRGRVEVTGGFFLMAALLLYLDTEDLLLPVMVAVVLHEGGHWAAVRFMGGRISRLRLTAVGGELLLDRTRPLTKPRELFCILAGPAINLMAAWGSVRLGANERWQLFAGMNLCLGIFNLLPVWPLDGGRALRLLLERLLPDRWALRLIRGISGIISGCLLLLGLFQAHRTGGNLTLCVLAVWLFVGVKKGRDCRRSPGEKRVFHNRR